PNADWLVDSNMSFNVHYEHRTYFTQGSLTLLCGLVGLHVYECAPCYDDGQYLRLVGRLDTNTEIPRPATDERFLLAARQLGIGYHEAVTRWRDRLDRSRSGGRTLLWGAGGRGVSFLTAVDPDGQLIDLAVDIN